MLRDAKGGKFQGSPGQKPDSMERVDGELLIEFDASSQRIFGARFVSIPARSDISTKRL